MAKSHPFHYSEEKSLMQKLLDYGVPLILFWLYFQFYNFGKITPSEMIKTTGLLSIALLSLTLLIGPICRFFPALDSLKAHRKFWGITSFFVGLIHFVLIFIYYFNSNLFKIFNPASEKYYGLLAGIVSLALLFLVTLTSNKFSLKSLIPKVWKLVQSLSFLALIFAVLHFYLVESVNGVLVIKRLLGQITYYFATIVIIVRTIVLFFL